MSKSRHTEAQMIGAVKKWEAGCKPADVARELGVARQTIYYWQAKYGRTDTSHAGEAEHLELCSVCRQRLRNANTRLRKVVAHLT